MGKSWTSDGQEEFLAGKPFPLARRSTGRRNEMFGKPRGADMVEWIVGVVIVLSVLGTSVYALLTTVGNKFTEMNESLQP
jgi:hypothetical protein